MGLGTAASTAATTGAQLAMGPMGWASLALNAGLSAYQMIEGAANTAEANAKTATAVNNLLNTKAEDKFAALTVPMKGFELAQQNQQAREQSFIRSAQESGAAGVIGAVPGLMAGGQQADLQLAAQVEQAQSQLQMQKAANQQDIENARVNTERNLRLSEIQGGQRMAGQGMDRESQGMAGLAGAVSNAAFLNAYMNKDRVGVDNTVTTPPQVPAANLGVPSGIAPGITGSYLTQQGATPIPGAVINTAPNWQNNYNNFVPTTQPTPGMYNGIYQTGDPFYDMYMNNTLKK
ncbi:MAG: hypothetical protein RL624_207 [Bacteroidota bacterium]|jgi:hypothetical protein